MNAQFKKGVLELVVLESVRKKDMYGYELVEEGPPRKYYHLTAAGVLYREKLEQEWNEFQQRVCTFLKEQKDE